MFHGLVFVTYNQQGGPRGEGKAESTNYFMFMEQHRLGSGTMLRRQMFSAESLISPHPGFFELFQTGETYHGQPLVDHQHPHNVLAELAALYTLPVNEKVTWLLYGGPSAEPALGPVTYMHRQSASENPEAPLGHHLQDSTHTSFGVVTTGFIFNFAKSALFKVEGSAFNGHEPNEERWSIQLAPLDSWSFRVSAAPTRSWTAQYSMGFLQHPEALDPNNELRAVGLARVQSIVARRKAGERQLGKFVDLGAQAQGTGQHYPEQLSARIDPELSGAELRLYSPRTAG